MLEAGHLVPYLGNPEPLGDHLRRRPANPPIPSLAPLMQLVISLTLKGAGQTVPRPPEPALRTPCPSPFPLPRFVSPPLPRLPPFPVPSLQPALRELPEV